MKKENKLIAEFMGMETDENGMYRYTTSVDDYTTDDLSYFEYSWDWLMPVVEKCFHIEDMTHGLVDSNLNATYKAVIEFINEYNKNK
tara:strand:- start:198 stop:458 length:261 start_codon:yes stop_codon:yes gene_type:complete